MNRTAFVLYRALFVQPKGMVLNIARSKLRRGGRAQSVAPFGRSAIDAQYGIDTAGVIAATDLRTGSRSDLQNFGYVGSIPSIVRAVLDRIPDAADAAFVDMGCGKGRAVVVASEYPFRRVIGVELAAQLAAVARTNAARVGESHPQRRRIEIVEGDATAYELPPGYVVIFMYNPAYRPMIKKIVDNAAAHGGKVMLIYYNPASGRVVNDEPEFTRYFAGRLDAAEDEVGEFGNHDDSVVVWQNSHAPMYPPQQGANARLRVVAGGSAGHVD